MKPTNLETIADGVAAELFGHEMQKIAENILDENTNWKNARKITIEFSFAPDEKREEVRVTVSAKSKLATVKPYSKTSFMGKKNGKATMYCADERQTDMLDEDISHISQKRPVTNA